MVIYKRSRDGANEAITVINGQVSFYQIVREGVILVFRRAEQPGVCEVHLRGRSAQSATFPEGVWELFLLTDANEQTLTDGGWVSSYED